MEWTKKAIMRDLAYILIIIGVGTLAFTFEGSIVEHPIAFLTVICLTFLPAYILWKKSKKVK